MRNPLPTLSRLREAGAVVRVKVPFLGKTWIATTHEAVNEVLKDDGTLGFSPASRTCPWPCPALRSITPRGSGCAR
jgi:hypothetical protein